MVKILFTSWTIICLTLLALFSPGIVNGAIYTFVDDAGVIHFSNVPNDSRYRPLYHSRTQNSFDSYIKAAASRHDVDPLLVKAVIKVESDFDRYAISKKGAKGLMQLMPETMQDMNVADPFDPEDNIHGGTRYLKKLLTRFNEELKLTLAAYNAGPNRVSQLGRIPRIPETQRYVKKVLKSYKKYRKSPFQKKRLASVAYFYR